MDAEKQDEEESEIPDTGAVFTFGRSRFGDDAFNRFWIRNDPIKLAACGDEHTLLLTESGRVFSFGANDWGQLGHGNTKTYTKPTSLKAIKGQSARLIACGRSHSFVVLDSNCVLAFGQNTCGELGVGDVDQHPLPVEVQHFQGHVVTTVAGGAHHSVALTNNGQVHVWGSNSEQQLGLPNADETTVPLHLEMTEKIKWISCGYYHTAAVTVSGKLYTFGEDEDGKLGHSGNTEPLLVEKISEKIEMATCGGKHTVAVTEDGHGYVFGNNSYGQLGLGENVPHASYPTPLNSLENCKVEMVSCGESHTAVVSDHHQLYTWGCDNYGKLCHMEERVQKGGTNFLPRRVEKFVKFDVMQVVCGGCHTIVLAKPNPNWEARELEISKHAVQTHARPIASRRRHNIETSMSDEKTALPDGPIDAVNGDGGRLPNARIRRRQLSLNASQSQAEPSAFILSLPPHEETAALDTSTLPQLKLSGYTRTQKATSSNCSEKTHVDNLPLDTESRKHSLEQFSQSDDGVHESSNGDENFADMRHRKNGFETGDHFEINRSLTVIRCSPFAEENPEDIESQDNQEKSRLSSAKSDSQQQSGRNTIYAKAPIPPPVRITSVARKYAKASEDGFSAYSAANAKADEPSIIAHKKIETQQLDANVTEMDTAFCKSDPDADIETVDQTDRHSRSKNYAVTREDLENVDGVEGDEQGQRETDKDDKLCDITEGKPEVKSAFDDKAEVDKLKKLGGKTKGRLSKMWNRLKPQHDTEQEQVKKDNTENGGANARNENAAKSRACVVL